MSDIPEPLADSPEGTQTRVESTKWDIGNAALPTTVTTNRFDIVSNGSLTVEPVLPMDTSQSGKVLGASPLPVEIAGTTSRDPNAINSPVERVLESSPTIKTDGKPLGHTFESGLGNDPALLSSPRAEGLAHTLPHDNSTNQLPLRTTQSSEVFTARPDLKVSGQETNYLATNALQELVTPRITLTKAVNDSLPTFELVGNQNKIEKHVESVKFDPIQKQLPKAGVEGTDNNPHIQEGSAKVLARMNQTVESVLSNHESRTANVQTALHLASNVKIDETAGHVRLSSIENNVPSLRFQNLVRSASEIFTARTAHFENLTKSLDTQRLAQQAGSLRNLEIARQINLNGTLQASFNIKPSIDTLISPSISDRRAPSLIGLVKDVLTNPGANASLTGAIRSDALSAQGILRSQFSTVRGDGLTPLSFTIKDGRTSINAGDPRLPGYLEIGRRKKKKKNGEEEDECATNLSPESCRYISGLELGLLIALAGIARHEGPDRTNRKVVKENLSENFTSNSQLSLNQTREFISDAIKQNKIEKSLSSKQQDKFKSPTKIKLKNLLQKLKEEMRELSAKDFEKLQSSDTKEELLDRLSKIVANDEKRLFTKRQLSSFATTKQEILTQKNPPAAPPSSQIVSYRPLWLVTVNDTLTKLAEQIYQDPEVGWLIADMNLSRVKERYVNGKRVIELQSRQQIELPIQEDIDLFKLNKPKEASAEKLITIVQANQLDKELINSQLQALQIKRKAFGTT